MRPEAGADSWVADERYARAAWSRLAEPGDPTAGALVGLLGPARSLSWLAEVLAAVGGPDGAGGVSIAPTAPTAGGPERPAPALPAGALVTLAEHGAPLDATALRRLTPAVARWASRWDGLDPRRDLDGLHALGGRLLHPGDPAWPTGLDDLGATAPPCLWVRGEADLARLGRRSVALVGARASTAYGDHVTTEIAAGLGERGFTVVSGGAYGIDAAAHRGAVQAGAPTVALLAGGVDRPYPAGNAGLLRAVVDAGGTVVSEVPPGGVPSRSRFLLRNRLIAALGHATVVVEAAWRSGALSTAGHAAALLRPVGAVPGPVTSMVSAGCHRLLRDGAAVCVTDAAEVAELAGDLGDDLAPARVGHADEADGLGPDARRVLDALPVVRPAPTESVARAAGLAAADVRAALGLLELAGLATGSRGEWRRTRRPVEDGGRGQSQLL